MGTEPQHPHNKVSTFFTLRHFSAYALAFIFILLTIVLTNKKDFEIFQAQYTARTLGQSLPMPHLREESSIRGISYLHTQQSKGVSGLDEAMGSGACILDINNDDLPDIYIVGGSGHSRYYGRRSWWSTYQYGRLYQNQGNGYFKDITVDSGLDINFWGMSCSAADLDNDNKIDLVVTSRQQNYLFKNLGKGKFKASPLGNSEVWSLGATIGDVNNDGWLDIYVSNYIDYHKTAKRLEKDSGFTSKSKGKYLAANYPPIKNELYINTYKDKTADDAPFSFNEVASQLGVANEDGRTLGAKIIDINNDSWSDLITLNDKGSPTQLYINSKGKQFSNKSAEFFIDLPSGIRDASFADSNGDSQMDIIFSTIIGNAPVLYHQHNKTLSNWNIFSGNNKLTAFHAWGTSFVDINNDGYQDIYHANGLQTSDIDSHDVSQGQPDYISLALSDSGNFAPALRSPIANSHSSRSILPVDIDNDGDKDLLITANNNPVSLLVNHTPLEKWIGFDLTDKNGHKHQFKQITIHTTQRKVSFFEDAHTFLGKKDGRITLALSKDETPSKAVIIWKDGSEHSHQDLTTNHYLKIQQNNKTIIRRYAAKTTLKNQSTPSAKELILWQIKSQQFDPLDVTVFFQQSQSNQDKIEILRAAQQYDKKRRLLGILQLGLYDDSDKVVLATLEILKAWELEQSYAWFEQVLRNIQSPSPLLKNADTINHFQAELSQIFRHFYIEEEALVQRKHLAVPLLVQQLQHEDKEVVFHTVLALGESKSIRAVAPLEALRQATQDDKIRDASNWALNELRHSQPKQQRTSSNYGVLNLTERQTKTNIKPAGSSCIKTSEKELKALHLRQQAAIFSLCPMQEQKAWFEEHQDFTKENFSRLLTNPHLHTTSLQALLEASAKTPSSGFHKILLSQLKRTKKEAHKVLLLNSLSSYASLAPVKQQIRAILADNQQARKVRIAAGNSLIDIDPDTVMQHANNIFYGK